MTFKPLNEGSVKDREQATSKYWEDINLLNLSTETRKDGPHYVFYDGPPTANGKPGIHHVIARTLKDMTSRYKNMKGYKVLKKAGWDTHGLPVEIEVEKALGFHDKNDIEKYGIKEFNEKCKESVWKYKTEWEKMTREIGYFIDMNEPYIRCDNNY